MAFGGMPRAKFIQALTAEGIPCSGGYSPLNKESFLPTALDSKGFRRIYPRELLDRYEERNHCPANERLCQEAVWFTQTMFLGNRERHGSDRRGGEEVAKEWGSAGEGVRTRCRGGLLSGAF